MGEHSSRGDKGGMIVTGGGGDTKCFLHPFGITTNIGGGGSRLGRGWGLPRPAPASRRPPRVRVWLQERPQPSAAPQEPRVPPEGFGEAPDGVV